MKIKEQYVRANQNEGDGGKAKRERRSKGVEILKF